VRDNLHSSLFQVRVQIPDVCKRAGIHGANAPQLFESRLSKMLRSSVLETAVRELQSKAQGLFLYASLLALQLETATATTTTTTSGNGNENNKTKKKIDFKELSALPNGLSEVYQVNFERMVQSRQQAWDDSYSQLIALIVAAREPLPAALTREVCASVNRNMLSPPHLSHLSLSASFLKSILFIPLTLSLFCYFLLFFVFFFLFSFFWKNPATPKHKHYQERLQRVAGSESRFCQQPLQGSGGQGTTRV